MKKQLFELISVHISLLICVGTVASSTILDGSVEVGKGSVKINITEPDQLFDLGEHEDLEIDDVEDLPDGSFIAAASLLVHGYPIWDSQITLFYDPAEAIPWSISADDDIFPDDLEDRVASQMSKVQVGDFSRSISICEQKWKSVEESKMGEYRQKVMSTKRYVMYDELSDTVALADDIKLRNAAQIDQAFNCLVDAVNGTAYFAVKNSKSAVMIGGNKRIGAKKFSLKEPVIARPNENKARGGNKCVLATPDRKIIIYDAKFSKSEDVAVPFTYDCNKGFTSEKDDAVNGGFGIAAIAFYHVVQMKECLAKHVNFTNLESVGPNNTLKIFVHYGKNFENAEWQDGFGLLFGDGAGNDYPYATAIGIVGHEVAHALTSKFSNLVYEGESGGMNEAFSDMAGQFVRQCVRGKTDFAHDLEADRRPEANANDYIEGIRNLKLPTSNQEQIKKYSDFDKPAFGLNSEEGGNHTDVHVSSGLYNHVFYRLATAGKGWDAIRAFRLFFGANKLYWTAKSTFADGACGVLRYAQDLSYNSADIQLIVAAFKAVEIEIPKTCSALAKNKKPIAKTKPSAEYENEVPLYDLKNCQTLSGLSGSKGVVEYYTLTVANSTKRPPNSMVVSLRTNGDATSVNADLFIKYGQPPSSPSDYDLGEHLEGNGVTATIRCPQPGSYYFIIQGYGDYDDVDLNACYVHDGSSTVCKAMSATLQN